MTRTFAAAIFVLLAITAPARAADVWYQIDTLNLLYPNNTTLTGDLYIQDGAPQVGGYIAEAGESSLDLNGTPLTILGGDAPSGTPAGGTGTLYTVGPFITFPVFPSGIYGESPLYLSASSIFLNGTAAISGTVGTEFYACTDGSCINAAPLPPALPLFGAALAALGGAGWIRRKKI